MNDRTTGSRAPSHPTSDIRHPTSLQISPSRAVLWASAFVIFALVIVQASRLGGAPALANDNTEVGALRLMTAGAGNNEDLLAVINHIDETLSVYMIENGRSLELYQVQSIPDLFTQARGGPAGRR